MSTTTVSVRSTVADAEIADVRRLQAEAREAARRARQRAMELENERRREAAARQAASRRLEAAKHIIANQEAIFQREIARLDDAARRLPDLTLPAPTLPVLRAEDAQDPGTTETYAARVAAEVQRFSQQLDAAIAEAERLLKRRIAKAAAWRSASDIEDLLRLRRQASAEAAALLGTQVLFPDMLDRPEGDADLEAVEAYIARLLDALQDMDRVHASLMARIDARKRAADLRGPAVQTRSASYVHAKHEAERLAAVQAVVRATVAAELSSAGLNREELPQTLRYLIDDAIAHPAPGDGNEHVRRWILREKQRSGGVQRALELMQRVPAFVHEDFSMSQRWSSLVGSLQRIANGLEEFTPSTDREYEQLCNDACRKLKTEFAKADWLRAMSEQGFEVLEVDDGQGLVIVDLDHPDVWLEATELDSEKGAFGAVLELKTDADLPPEVDARVTSDICSKLAQVAGAAAPKVVGEDEVIEHSDRITRGRRPARARKAFLQGV